MTAGAVLATTGLLGAYMGAFRPQPTYASPSRGAGQLQPQTGPLHGRLLVTPATVGACGTADDTVSNETDLRNAILASVDGSVICIDGTITLNGDLPSLDDSTVTFVGDDSGVDGIDGNSYQIFHANFDDTVPTAQDDTLTIANLTLEGGSSTRGGAVRISGDNLSRDVLVLEESTLSSNSATAGGALAAQDAVVYVSSSSLVHNQAAQYGGAIFASDGRLIVTNSFVGENYGAFAGGTLAAVNSEVGLVFSTIYDDSALFPYLPQTIYMLGGTLDAVGSVVGISTDDSLLALSGTAIDDSYSVSTGPTSVFTDPTSRTVAPGSLQLGALDGTGPGQLGRSPASSSVLVTAAPTSDLGTGVTVDQLGVLRGPTWTIGARQVAAAPAPPPPTPAFPPSAPRDVVAEPGNGEAVVSWTVPASPGSYPITHYRVTAEPGGASCLVPVTETSCAVPGLTNGRVYTFTVEALNGAGWGARGGPSNPVTPEPSARALVLDQGTRKADGRHDRIRTGGSSVGVPAGSRLTPYIRYAGQQTFQEGKATITVQSDGSFTWTRQIKKGKGLTAYVAWEDLESNRVFWAKIS